MTARNFGLQKGAEKAVAGSISIRIIVCIVIVVIGLISLKLLMIILDNPFEIINDFYSNICVMVLLVIVMFAYNLCTGLLRTIKNSFIYLSDGVMKSGVNTVILQSHSVMLIIFF